VTWCQNLLVQFALLHWCWYHYSMWFRKLSAMAGRCPLGLPRNLGKYLCSLLVVVVSRCDNTTLLVTVAWMMNAWPWKVGLTRVSEFKNPWGSLGLYRFCVLFVCVCKFTMAHYICRIAYQGCTRPYFKSAISHLLPPRGFHIFHRISLRCQPSPHFMPFSGTFLGQIMGPKPGWGWSFADRIRSTLNYQYISWFWYVLMLCTTSLFN